MILSNITVPLLGLVDTAVIGHLAHSYYLGGSTVGAMVITFIIWFSGFLRSFRRGSRFKYPADFRSPRNSSLYLIKHREIPCRIASACAAIPPPVTTIETLNSSFSLLLRNYFASF